MEINIWQVLFQAANFGVILFFLNKLLYKPVLKMLDERALKINEGQVAAQKNLSASADLEKLKKQEISKARKEAAQIIEEAEVSAKAKADKILSDSRAKAKAEAEKIIADTKLSSEAMDKALTAKAATLAVSMSQKVLAEVIGAKDASQITDKLIAKLGKG